MITGVKVEAVQGSINSVKLSITGKLSFSDEISLSQAAQIIAFIDSSGSANLSFRPTAMSGAAAPPPAPPLELEDGDENGLDQAVSSMSPRDALDASKAKTNPQKMVALASVAVDSSGKFTFDDLKRLFERAREATPKNFTRDFNFVIRAGWADEASEKGRYYLTEKGQEALRAGFGSRTTSARAGAGAGKPRTAARKAKAPTVPDAFKDIDPIPFFIDGMPGFSQLGERKQRFLWALALAKSLQLEGLTNKEIVWLTDHLGSGIPTNNVNSAFATARSRGYANRSTITNKVRITPQGEEWLQSLAENPGN